MEIKKDAWMKFCDIIDTESNTSNFKIGFQDITKKFGAAYIEYCKAMWEANDGVMTEDEFIAMNGNMPKSFFENRIKK